MGSFPFSLAVVPVLILVFYTIDHRPRYSLLPSWSALVLWFICGLHMRVGGSGRWISGSVVPIISSLSTKYQVPPDPGGNLQISLELGNYPRPTGARHSVRGGFNSRILRLWQNRHQINSNKQEAPRNGKIKINPNVPDLVVGADGCSEHPTPDISLQHYYTRG